MLEWDRIFASRDCAISLLFRDFPCMPQTDLIVTLTLQKNGIKPEELSWWSTVAFPASAPAEVFAQLQNTKANVFLKSQANKGIVTLSDSLQL